MQLDPQLYQELKAKYGDPIPEDKLAEAMAAEAAKQPTTPAGQEPLPEKPFPDTHGYLEGTCYTQGKCLKCRVHYVWKRGRILVKEAFCPLCGDKLRATTRVSRWPREEIPRPLTRVEVWQKFKR